MHAHQHAARRRCPMRDTAAAGRRWRKAVPRPARLVVVAATALLSIGLAPGVAAARPTDPGDGAISAAQHTADTAAARLGQISAALAAAQTAVQRAQGEANIALDTYEGKQQDFETARAAAAV